MRKLVFFIIGLCLMGTVAKAQPVVDNGVIPISVTLNSILRLEIVSGGNIEFVVSTIDEYTNGITNAGRYDTEFKVASSRMFDVNLEAGVPTGVSTGGTLPLANICYDMAPATGAGTEDTEWDLAPAGAGSALTPLTATVSPLIDGGATSAGSGTQNYFIINWELATAGCLGATGGMGATQTLLVQSLPADYYTANIYLSVVPK